MYWWNLRAAKRQLSAQAPGARELLPYLIAVAILEGFIVEFSFLTPAQEDPGSPRVWLVAAGSVLLTVLGCVYVYHRNGGAGGRQFLERLLVLGWVSGVRYMAFLALALALFFGLGVALYPALGEALGDWADILMSLASAAFYLYLGHHIGDLARTASKEG
jgi:hypothetical protein